MAVASLRSLITLAVLFGLAGVLIWMLPADVLARPTFQSPLTPATRTPTPPATATVTATVSLSLAVNVGATATPLSQMDSPAAAPPAPGRGPGFLPPPTLSAGGLPPLAAGGRQTAPASATATPSPRPAFVETPAPALSLARLIDLGVLVLSYLWLGCGVVALIAAALILVWVARGPRRDG